MFLRRPNPRWAPISELRPESARADTPVTRSVSAIHCVQSDLMRAHGVLELDEEAGVEMAHIDHLRAAVARHVRRRRMCLAPNDSPEANHADERGVEGVGDVRGETNVRKLFD